MASGKAKKKLSALAKFSRLLWAVSLIFMGILGYFIYDANVLPIKYFSIIIGVLVIFILIHGFFILKRKTKKWVLIVIDIFTLIFMCGEAFAIIKINETISFLRANLGAKYETNIYNVVVNKESSYHSLEDIKNKVVVSYKDLDNMNEVEMALKKKVEVSFEYADNVIELMNKVLDDKEIIILVNSGNYDAMVENDEKYESKVTVLDHVEIKTMIEYEENKVNITSEPFVVYLSGIDTRSGTLPSRSLSDVNIILAVNPKQKKILMVHVPRDFYVQVHGTDGALRDKLTHSGTIGGVSLTMQTIQDLFEIEVPYFVRVNFNSVINLVDAIGGLNVNSDVNYSFVCWTDKGCTIYPGINSLDGRCTLAFARERFAYSTGDRHRGENQEQVISLIIDKVGSSSTLISNYSNILNALNGTFETNISTDDITSLVRMQLDDMTRWNIETYNVNGTGSLQPTYSYPNLNLYVMEPDMETIKVARQKLDEVLETVNE